MGEADLGQRIFNMHEESTCIGDMFRDEENGSICCTEDSRCPVLLGLLNAMTQQN